jgi:hypothetical protein
MIVWIIKLWANPLARRIIIYAAVIAAICYGMRLWANKQWAKGEAQGRQAIAQDIEKRKRAEWKAKEDAIAKDAANLITEKHAVEVAATQLSKDRSALTSGLKDSLSRIQKERNKDYEKTAVVPDDRLDTALRSISAELSSSAIP